MLLNARPDNPSSPGCIPRRPVESGMLSEVFSPAAVKCLHTRAANLGSSMAHLADTGRQPLGHPASGHLRCPNRDTHACLGLFHLALGWDEHGA